MINHHMILEGIKYGLVQFMVDPNLEHGTVCAIGNSWFYFGGETAEEMNPEDYLRATSLDHLVDKIISALEGLRTPPDEALYDEYAYYEAVLTEALGAKQPYITREEAIAQRDAAVADLAKLMTELRGSSFCTDSKRWGFCVNPTCYAHGGDSSCEFMWRGTAAEKEVLK